jgi:transcriptional regulator with XRE-family HTH domain
MTEIPNKNYMALSDKAIMEKIGSYIRHQRLDQNKTQSQLAFEAGLNRSTLVEFEQGNGGNLITLIQLIRGLKLLEVLNIFEIKSQFSPIQLAKLEQKRRKRASKNKRPAKNN